jgi:hypothetical protein
MTRFSDWLSSALNTENNMASKEGNFIRKTAPMVGSFIGKAAPILSDIDNFIIYLPGKLGTIGKTINNVAVRIDSVTGMLTTDLIEKAE